MRMARSGDRQLVRTGIDHGDHQRDETTRNPMVVHMPVHLGKHVDGSDSAAAEVADLGTNAGHDQGRGHPLASDITQRDCPSLLAI